MKWNIDQLVSMPLPMHMRPIARAKRLYEKFSMCPFEQDLTVYLGEGFVVSLPHLFVMGQVINLSNNGTKRLAWFVRIAVGELQQLVQLFPFDLPEIAFCRRNDGIMRVFPLDRFRRFSKRLGRNQWQVAQKQQ